MSDESPNIGEGIAVGLIVSGVCVALGLAVSGGRVTHEGVTGHDLEMGFRRCEPLHATFEQTLACTRAVYGGR